ncbi:MAG: RNA polymerase sigma factor [bacterium]|nr:RNA polymerase sigma factor [bacterium]
MTPRSADNSVTPDEAVLIARARTGDTDAFGALVDAYTPRIYAHVYHVVRDRQEAEDVTQEAFVRALRALDRYDPARPFRNWLCRIATNAGLNALRSKRRRGVAIPLDDDEWTARQPTALGPNPSELAERGELATRLDEAVAQLPPRVGILVRLHYTEGFSIREAAESVGLSEGAAKTALCRARRQLRRLMTEGNEP